jgi:proteasome lid subunit RPN8/RPN11
MAKQKKGVETAAGVVIDGEVVRRIRQHARGSLQAEVCGVLIGPRGGNEVQVTASIAGENAAQAGTHVTFTQETWEHVYKIKDAQFPDDRIVGWYHSHPGFGVFLSDHDAFIHQNFFSSQDQIAWVFDPHSDEEGCFGWTGGRLERIRSIRVSDPRGGERVRIEVPAAGSASAAASNSASDAMTFPEPIDSMLDDEPVARRRVELPVPVLSVIATLAVIAAFTAGFLVAFYVFPRTVYVGVVVDPATGRPLLVDPSGRIAPAPPSDDEAREADGKR